MTQDIEIDRLDPHPDNPRLFPRQEIIDSIAVQIREVGYFDEAHALIVRPLDERYQIVSGHHRWEAAKQVGLESVPCWVREMTDEEAYMQLALSNVQGELSPLEIGVHALGIEFDRRGRGASGNGLKGYAKNIGKDAGDITNYRQAALVLKSINWNIPINKEKILDKASHLAAIHSAPQEIWPILVNWIITPKDPTKPNGTPSVNQTQELVKEISKYDVPERWQGIFLPLTNIVSSYINSRQPTAKIISQLVEKVEMTEKVIAANAENFEGFPYSVKSFHQWLTQGLGITSWDINEIQGYLDDVIREAQEAAKPPEPDPKPGEWWQLGEHLLYCGNTGQPEFHSRIAQVTFAFADPPYNANAAEWDQDFQWNHDWLIDKAPIVAVTPGIEAIDSFFRDDTQMPYVWSMACWITNGMTRGKLGYGNWIYVALFSSLDSIFRQEQDFIQVTISTSKTKETRHKGRKPEQLLERLLDIFTEPEDIVIDPFLGSGTTLLVAEKKGRRCIGGEINPEFCKEIIQSWQNSSGQIAHLVGEYGYTL